MDNIQYMQNDDESTCASASMLSDLSMIGRLSEKSSTTQRIHRISMGSSESNNGLPVSGTAPGDDAIRKCISHSNDAECCQPDLYQDDADAGPRSLLEPARIDPLSPHDADADFVDAVTTFNVAVANHRRKDYDQAYLLYELTLNDVLQLLSASDDVPSATIIELSMHAHNNLGVIAYMEGEHEDAKANFDAALLFARQLNQRAGQVKNLSVATVLSNWCRVHWMCGDIATDPLLQGTEEVLHLRTESLPWYHMDVASSHFNLAVACHACGGRAKEALFHLQKYLEVSAHNAQSGENQLDPVPALIYILLVRFEDKNDAMPQELTRGLRTLQDKRQEDGPNSPEVAAVLNFVGTLLFHCKEFDNALSFFEEELRVEEGLDQRDRVSLSVTCNNIGRTLQESGKLKEAIVYYKRALSADFKDSMGFKKFLGETRATKDPTTTNLFSTVWYNLGLIHDKLGSATEAISAFQISLNLRKIILGPQHPDIACLWYNIGVLQMEKNFLDDAHVSFREAFAIRAVCTEHQLDDERMIQTLEKLSSLQRSTGSLDGAITALDDIGHLIFHSASHSFIKRQHELSRVYYRVAEIHHDMGDCVQSFHMAQKAIQVAEAAAPSLEDGEDSLVDKVALLEQWALAYLLVGSLLHEQCEAERAYHVLQQTIRTLDSLQGHPLFATPSLLALRQVALLLATPRCAPVA
jgi:tetratricopeptide (TPR) repeat protein